MVDFSSDRAFLVLLGLVFAGLSVAVLAVRRGRLGRRLAALRDSDAACATLGMDVRGPKLVLFATSAAIAGLAGALLGGFSAVVSDVNFDPIFNLQIFPYAFVGGVTTITGALIGGALFTVFTVLQTEQPTLSGLVFAGIGAAAVALGKQPNGLAGMLYDRLDDLRRRWDAAGSAEPASPAEPLVPSRSRPWPRPTDDGRPLPTPGRGAADRTVRRVPDARAGAGRCGAGDPDAGGGARRRGAGQGGFESPSRSPTTPSPWRRPAAGRPR